MLSACRQHSAHSTALAIDCSACAALACLMDRGLSWLLCLLLDEVAPSLKPFLFTLYQKAQKVPFGYETMETIRTLATRSHVHSQATGPSFNFGHDGPTWDLGRMFFLIDSLFSKVSSGFWKQAVSCCVLVGLFLTAQILSHKDGSSQAGVRKPFWKRQGILWPSNRLVGKSTP